MADKTVALEHKTLKAADGKSPRTHLATPKEAEVLMRGDRGWKKATKATLSAQSDSTSTPASSGS